MRILFTGIFIFIGSQSILSQNQFAGFILSSEDFSSIEGAHILNVSKGKLAFTKSKGEFQIPADIGDTLSISYVGFQSKQIIIENFDFKVFSLKPEVVELKEVQVTRTPEDEYRFKKRIIKQEMIETEPFIPFGVTPGKPKGKIPKQYERKTEVVFGADEQFNPSVTIPISYFTKKYSKKHKAKRDYFELKASKEQRILNQKKYNKEMITRLTGLKNRQLMDFMSFMNLNKDFISAATDYEIVKTILDSYKKYQAKISLE
ncbi:hypothetical protein MATR_28350 [Marivirga tractuosa]|uniref:TonB-dependent receptor n=1 Tax=Marivirga tractuosa (strain ATCC 23168 / DSM 4126 / NBRC 15989 / NCIMB 1408 / VKM B-1430 / H-43) TaxID=643867 RepID=E4TL39_MARTH|nr:hypothetical protein [Marivirga tractuosa]ADR23316.1 hypothetical protein Ftrac_3342 [Marivirga tractuosa DSM 4126]BDD16010.1 hypothetical protein MATR_28350 [Marivirga tractuosa]